MLVDPKSMFKQVLGFGYIVLVIGGQILINVLNTKELCSGVPQVGTAFIYTLIPNFFILGLIMVILSVFPGWKSPFSNTIGYGIVWMLGVNSTLIKLLKDESGSKLMQQILSNKALIVNEITRDNFKVFLSRMSKDKLLEKNYKSLPAYKKLWKFVVVKDSIAEFIWIMLTGSLVISTIYNNLLDINCDIPSSVRKEAAAKFEADMKQKTKNKKEDKLYPVHD